MSDENNINFILGEIVGTQREILKVVQDNKDSIVDQNKRIDEVRRVTKDEFEQNRGRIDKIEKDMHAARWVSRMLLWLGGALGSAIAWVAHKTGWV